METMTEGTNLERKYPLWDILDNRIEIEEISQRAAKMMDEDFDDLRISEYWIAVPRCTVDLLQELFMHLGHVKEEAKGPVTFKVGDLMTIGVEGLITKDADKTGTLNPIVELGPELDYENRDDVYSNMLSADMAAELEKMGVKYLLPQFYEDRKVWEKICQPCMKKLGDKYQIMMSDWSMVLLAMTYFFRAAFKWLIEHKDDNAVGTNIMIAELIEFGIRKDGPDDDVEYYTYITPSRYFKRESAKSDAITENMGA